MTFTVKKIAYIGIVALVCLLSKAACAERVSPAYTLMVYMVGSDLESDASLASADIKEMQASIDDAGGLNLLICAGGTNHWQIPDMQQNGTSIYRVMSNTLKHINTLASANMGDQQTLQQFLDYGMSQFPAEHYALIFWDHGSGPLIGFGGDDNYHQDMLTLPELQLGLEKSEVKKHGKLDWIGFDACLMGSLESACALAPYTERLIASEEIELSIGWDYCFLPLLTQNTATDDICRAIVDKYYDTTVAYCGGAPDLMPFITLACYDLTQTDQLLVKLDSLAKRINSSLQYGAFGSISIARSRAYTISRASNTAFDLVDLSALCQQLGDFYPQETADFQSALKSWVLYMRSNSNNYCGVSIYFPYDAKEEYQNRWESMYLDGVGVSEAYTQLISRYSQRWLSGTMNQRETIKLWKEDDGRCGVQLSAEQLKNYSKGTFHLLSQKRLYPEEGYYYIMSIPAAEPNEKGMIYPAFSWQMLNVVSDQTGERFSLPAKELRRDEKVIQYQTYAVLQKLDTLETADMESAQVTITLDQASNRGYITSVVRNKQATVGKEDLNLANWEYIEMFGSARLPITNENNILLPYWDWYPTHNIRGCSFKTDDSFHFELNPVNTFEDNLFLQFEMKDVYNNTEASELLPIVYKSSDTADQPVVSPDLSVTWDAKQTEPLELLNDKGIQISLLSVDLVNGAWMKLLLANTSSQNVIFDVNRLRLNGVPLSAWCYEEIMPDSSQEVLVEIPSDLIQYERPASIQSAAIVFTVKDGETYDDIIPKQDICIGIVNWRVATTFNGYGWQDAHHSKWSTKERLLLDSDATTITLCPFVTQSYDGGQTFVLKIENHKDQEFIYDVDGIYCDALQASVYQTMSLRGHTYGYLEVEVPMEIQRDVYITPKEIGVKMSRSQENSMGIIEDYSWLSWSVDLDDSSTVIQSVESDYIRVALQDLDASQIFENEHRFSCGLLCTNSSDKEVFVSLTKLSVNGVDMASNIHPSSGWLLPNKSIEQLLQYQSDDELAEAFRSGAIQEIHAEYTVYDHLKTQLLDQFSLNWSSTVQ